MAEWLNVISGTLTGIAAFVLVLITLRYIRLTQDVLAAIHRPDIVIYLRTGSVRNYTRPPSNITQFYVKNVGTGLARKIRFGGDLEVEDYTLCNGSLLKGISFLNEGIDTLVPGEERTCRSTYETHEEADEQEELRLTVTVSYEDSIGNPYNTQFLLDFRDRTLPPIPK